MGLLAFYGGEWVKSSPAVFEHRPGAHLVVDQSSGCVQ